MGLQELAGVGFFMPEKISRKLNGRPQRMNAGGNASEVYGAIEQNG